MNFLALVLKFSCTVRSGGPIHKYAHGRENLDARLVMDQFAFLGLWVSNLVLEYVWRDKDS